jgi:hypothetical protein
MLAPKPTRVRHVTHEPTGAQTLLAKLCRDLNSEQYTTKQKQNMQYNIQQKRKLSQMLTLRNDDWKKSTQ